MRPRRDLDSSGGKRPLLSLGPPDIQLRLPGWRVYYDDRLPQSPADVVFTAETMLPFKAPCAKCVKVGGVTPNWVRYGFKWQAIHDVSIRGDRIMIRVLRRRYECATCKSTVWEPLPGRHVKRKATDRLVKYVEAASATRPLTDLAHELGISDRTVRRSYGEHGSRTARISETAPVGLGMGMRSISRRVSDFCMNHRIDGIILQDYNKGLMTIPLIHTIIDTANSLQIPTFVDPKEKTFFEYRNCTLFKPNNKEAMRATGQHLINPEKADQLIRQKLKNKMTVITLGKDGMYIHDGKSGMTYPTSPRDISDVCSAGDTVISVLCCCYLKGLDRINGPYSEYSRRPGMRTSGRRFCQQVNA